MIVIDYCDLLLYVSQSIYRDLILLLAILLQPGYIYRMRQINDLNQAEASYAAENIARMGDNLQSIYLGCLERITSALFLINGGGVVTILAYMYKSEGPNNSILLFVYSLCSFIVGLLLAFTYTALDFWLVRKKLLRFSNDAFDFFINKISFMEINLFDPHKKRASLAPLIFGFGSSIFSFLGIFQGITAFFLAQNININ